MAEPLDESVEVSWLEFFSRFEKEIYPALFESRGISLAEAMLLWEISNLRNEMTQLNEFLKEELQ